MSPQCQRLHLFPTNSLYNTSSHDSAFGSVVSDAVSKAFSDETQSEIRERFLVESTRPSFVTIIASRSAIRVSGVTSTPSALISGSVNPFRRRAWGLAGTGQIENSSISDLAMVLS